MPPLSMTEKSPRTSAPGLLRCAPSAATPIPRRLRTLLPGEGLRHEAVPRRQGWRRVAATRAPMHSADGAAARVGAAIFETLCRLGAAARTAARRYVPGSPP